MRTWRAIIRTCILGALTAGVSGAGCVVTIDPIDDGGGGGGDGSGSQDGTVTIRVVNNTTTGLDPEIYLADGPVSESELFDDSRKFVDFGVFGLGVIGALSSDSITVTCEQARMVGTKGGTFGETVQEPEGTGTKRVLAQELQFNCGDRITFIYSRAGDGFETTFEVD